MLNTHSLEPGQAQKQCFLGGREMNNQNSMVRMLVQVVKKARARQLLSFIAGEPEMKCEKESKDGGR